MPASTTNSVDDQFRSLMEGLRTTLPGAQVLLGFLLILPFQGLDGRGQVGVYAVALASSALASVLLIAPSVHQRVRAPVTGLRRQTRHHLDVAVRLTIAGSILLGVAIVASVGLVARVVLDDWFVVMLAGGVASTIAWSWLYLPLVAFRSDGEA